LPVPPDDELDRILLRAFPGFRIYAGPPICRPDVTQLSMREGHRRFVQQALRSLGMDR